ncbi:hypothetical protein WJX64_14560 [Leifsonia sp. YIM 134122]|uniref:DUF916 domain-containing protein n=1 Tax=Leifsonia stereocauli TaxID=3134136 RepID=A0ABU9W6Z5_9MICO
MHRIPLSARPIPRLALAGVLAVSALLGLVVAPASVSFADDTIGMAGAPITEAGTNGRTRFSYQMTPGQQVDDAYVVTNTGTVAQTFTVFATDAFNSEDGGYGLLDTGVTPTDAGSWVRFGGAAAPQSIPLEPGASQTVPFSVIAPADAAPGDHAAGLVVSAVSPDGQVVVDRRVGTRLYVRVPGELQPNLTISSITSSYAPSLNPLDGETTVTFTVKNAGNVALGANMVIGVKALFGIGTGDLVREELAEMLPRSTRTVSVVVPGVGQWGYLNPYVSMAPTVDPEALDPGPLTVVNRDTVLIAVPWILVILILLGLAVWLWMRFSRRRDEKNAKAWIEFTEAEARRKAAGGEELVDAGAGAGAGASAGSSAPPGAGGR